jgi:hypothetical protein
VNKHSNRYRCMSFNLLSACVLILTRAEEEEIRRWSSACSQYTPCQDLRRRAVVAEVYAAHLGARRDDL